MKRLDLTLPQPPANLALDEALLDACEANPAAAVLRFWEPADYFVVVGYANRVHQEVNVQACHHRCVPVLRRCSGGGTVLQGPGCLNYTLALRIDSAPELLSITGANRYIMERNRASLSQVLNKSVEVKGFTDLALNNVKFSGNAQRRKRQALLFHGTFLLNFDIERVQELLHPPSKEPDYRKGRSHGTFLTNLETDASHIKSALLQAWSATELYSDIPDPTALVAEKYDQHDWNWKF